MLSDSKFVKHIPCSACGSRDNRGLWDDGHEYCFGCKDGTPPKKTIEQLKNKLNPPKILQPGELDLTGYTTVIPKHALAWLASYGMEKLPSSVVLWNPMKDRLAFTLGNPVRLTNERYFGDLPNQPKYLTRGNKNSFSKVYSSPDELNKDTLVLTEDVLSSLKISFLVPASPLLGATINSEGLSSLATRFKHLRVWLDMDKAVQALQIASLGSQFFETSKVVITSLDPKEYNERQIVEHLQKSL